MSDVTGLVEGNSYLITFDLAKNLHGVKNALALNATGKIIGDGFNDYTFEAAADGHWISIQRGFLATKNTIKLCFQSTTDDGRGPVIDNVVLKRNLLINGDFDHGKSGWLTRIEGWYNPDGKSMEIGSVTPHTFKWGTFLYPGFKYL